MLPRHRDLADAPVVYDATPTDYAQVACLVAAWFVGRRSGRRWPVWSVAGLCALAAITALVYAVTAPG